MPMGIWFATTISRNKPGNWWLVFALLWTKPVLPAGTLLIAGTTAFCNRTMCTAAWERTEILARARRDIKL